jgi:uncharacterized protein (DUF934 family)
MQLIAPGTPLPEGALAWDNTVDPLRHADEARQAEMISLHFPKWTDGRAYSQAVLLRARLRYAGEIRATGEVLVDMLPLLRRCGFDSAQLRAGQSVEAAERSLRFFPGHYQADAAGGAPRFHASAAAGR